jgi:acyl-CoA hydrolase
MEGATITVPRTGPHWIVTENGAVNLKGRSMWERAELLISIADPAFQDDLVREAERMGLWKTSSKVTY